MTLQLDPIARRTVSEAVFEKLLADVLTGAAAPGDPLPSERALADAFAVNRHAVREALKRLQQAGLVEIAQGGATRVCDWRRTAGLDVLVALAGTARGELRDALLRDVVEMRAAVGADVARACAARAPGALDGMDAHPVDDEEAYVDFWAAIVDGADNLAYRLALNTLVAAQRHGAIDARLYAEEWADAKGQRRLAAAIAAGDPEAAHAAASALLGRTVAEVDADRPAAGDAWAR